MTTDWADLKDDEETIVAQDNTASDSNKDNNFSPSSTAGHNKFFKTRLCVKYARSQSCPFGDGCSYAHGVHELRVCDDTGEDKRKYQHQQSSDDTAKKYTKTKLCAKFTKNGNCRLGDNCNYAHGMNELRSSPAPIDSVDDMVEDDVAVSATAAIRNVVMIQSQQESTQTVTQEDVEKHQLIITLFRELLSTPNANLTCLTITALEHSLNVKTFLSLLFHALFSNDDPFKLLLTHAMLLRQISISLTSQTIFLDATDTFMKGDYAKYRALTFKYLYDCRIVDESVLFRWIRSKEITPDNDSIVKLASWLESVRP